MAAVFVSYAREDRASAECLARVLEGAGHEVWWDRRLDGGEEFGAEIEAALARSGVVLVAWSKESIKSRWVRDEAAVGGDTGRLVPVSIDGSLPPMGFRQFHTLDLSGWKGAKRDERTAELLRSVQRRLKGGEAPAPAAGATETKRRFSFPAGRQLWVVAALLILAAAVAGALLFQNARKAVSGPSSPRIALLPFNTASPDPELREVATQARDSVAHTFSQSGVPLRLLTAAPQDGAAAADFLISGDVSRNGDKVLATVRLDEAAHGVTVYSHRFEATGEDVRNLAERIGAQLAGNLTWSWPLMVLDRRRPLDPALMADLLQNDFTNGDPLQAYQNGKRVAAHAPNVQSAQINVAFNTAFALAQLPRAERAEAVAEALRAAERASVGSKFGDARSPWCLLHSETLFAECEDRLRASRRLDPDAPFLNTFLSHRLRDVGRFEESTDLARLAYTHDVYVPTKIAWMLKSLEYTGEAAAAQALYQQGARWWPEYKPMFFRNRLFGLIERADFDGIRRVEQEIGPKDLPDGYTRSDSLVAALKTKSLAAVRRNCPQTDAYLLSARCMIAFAMLGDEDNAYAIADKLYPRRIGRTPAETERIWLDDPEGGGLLEFVTSPGAAPMRRDPRYLQLAERTGLLAYWRSGRPPDFCRKQPEPICPRLLGR